MQRSMQTGTLRVLSGPAVNYLPDIKFGPSAYSPISPRVSRSPFYIGTPNDYRSGHSI